MITVNTAVAAVPGSMILNKIFRKIEVSILYIMLQAASDWYWGSSPADDGKNADQNDESPETDEPESKEEEFHVEIEADLESVRCRDPIIMMFKLIDFDNGIQNLLTTQFADKLTKKESDGLMDLFAAILKMGIPSKVHLAVYSKMMIGEVILSFFASMSPTNPDAFDCWDRWLKYRLNEDIHEQLNAVDNQSLNKFFGTNSNAIGYDNNGKVMWCILSKHYDGYIDDDTQRKAVILLLMSFFWDLNRDQMDLKVFSRCTFCRNLKAN